MSAAAAAQARRDLRAMLSTGLTPTADIIAQSQLANDLTDREARAAGVLAGLTPRQFAADVMSLTALPRDLARNPDLVAELRRGNRLRAAGVVLVLVALAGGIALLADGGKGDPASGGNAAS